MSLRCSSRGPSGTIATSKPSRRRSANTDDEPLNLVREHLEVLRAGSACPGLTFSRRNASLADLQALPRSASRPKAIPRVRRKEAGRRSSGRTAAAARTRVPTSPAGAARRRRPRTRPARRARPCATSLRTVASKPPSKTLAERSSTMTPLEPEATRGAWRTSYCARDEHRRAEQERKAAPRGTPAGSSCACPSGAADAGSLAGMARGVQAEGASTLPDLRDEPRHLLGRRRGRRPALRARVGSRSRPRPASSSYASASSASRLSSTEGRRLAHSTSCERALERRQRRLAALSSGARRRPIAPDEYDDREARAARPRARGARYRARSARCGSSAPGAASPSRRTGIPARRRSSRTS